MTQTAVADPSLPPIAPPLTRRRKAAIIVRLLLAEGADIPLSELSHSHQAALGSEMAAMRYVDTETLKSVVHEFNTELERVGLTFPGNLDNVLDLLGKHISADTVAGLRAGQRAPITDPWARLARQPVDTLVQLAGSEAPEVAAVFLSKLDTTLAAEILGALPGDQARQIACAVSRTCAISPETVASIGKTLMEQVESRPTPAFAVPPAERVGAILNAAAAQTRNDVLDGLENEDTGFATHVRKAIFTFADIPARLDPLAVPLVTRDVTPDDLVTALTGASGDTIAAADFILDNMSRRMADQLRDQMGEAGTPDPDTADAAQSTVVGIIRNLEERGEITLRKPRDAAD